LILLTDPPAEIPGESFEDLPDIDAFWSNYLAPVGQAERYQDVSNDRIDLIRRVREVFDDLIQIVEGHQVFEIAYTVR